MAALPLGKIGTVKHKLRRSDAESLGDEPRTFHQEGAGTLTPPARVEAEGEAYAWIGETGNQAGLGGSRLRRNLTERLGIAHGEVGQHLAVHGDAGFAEAVHEGAVGQAVLSRRSIDTQYPQPAQVAPALPTTTISVVEAVNHGLVRHLVAAATRPVLAFRPLEHLLVPAMIGDAALDPYHVRILLCLCRPGR